MRGGDIRVGKDGEGGGRGGRGGGGVGRDGGGRRGRMKKKK